MILPNPIEATGKSGPNWPKIILTGFIIIAGLFLIWQFTFATIIFEDNFNSYSTGDLEEGSWELQAGFDSWQVQATNTFEGSRAIKCDNGNCFNFKTGENATTGSFIIYAFADYCGGPTDNRANIDFVSLSNPANPKFSFNLTSFCEGVSGATSFGRFAVSTWTPIMVEWNGNAGQWRGKLATSSDSVFSAWLPIASTSIDRVRLKNSTQPIYFDTIRADLPECGNYTNPYACEYEGPNAEPTLNCSWNYASSTCGPYQAPPATTTSFIDYYGEHSSFATPTDFILSIYGFTSPLIENINSFLTGFDDIFDKQEASEKGAEFGSAIPTARGYLAIINDFFAGFPVSELFIFLILTIIVIIVFRVIRILVQALKVW